MSQLQLGVASVLPWEVAVVEVIGLSTTFEIAAALSSFLGVDGFQVELPTNLYVLPLLFCCLST